MTPPDPRIIDLPPDTEPTEPTVNPEPVRPPRPRRLKILEAKLHQLYMQPALIAQVTIQAKAPRDADGGIIADETTARIITGVNNYVSLVPNTVEAWMELAEQNTRVEAMLSGLVDGSVIGTIVVNHLMMVVPFLPPELIERINPLTMRRRSGGGNNGNGHGF